MTITTVDEFSHVLPTLERFRKKLLELSTWRNSLLDLKFSKQKSLRLLRFVDCNPQAVLDGLISGRQYSIRALPEFPKGHHLDVDDVAVEPAPEQSKEEDPLNPQNLRGGSDDEATQFALIQADDGIRTSVTESLEAKLRNAKSSRHLAAWAEKQGINPSYSLVLESESGSDKGALQVIQLEVRMEKIAETIRKQAQSSIEETGNNILYLAFGCLRWKEKEKQLHAPLILLPVEITKTTGSGGVKTFNISALDETPEPNVTLKERLRSDFGIDLPMPNLLADPFRLEPYLKQVAECLSGLPDWGIENYLNLALFNFGGLELYEDLMPEDIASSSMVKQLLSAEVGGDEQVDNSPVVAADLNVDLPEISNRVPVLIAQADASQFAAVADVMAGRSMVIEGPPGTGKSQTITNIIANALYAGKRVLFVAEKKVALDVVYHRLSEAGLKPYCLRIESDKANKKQIYDELAERIDLAAPPRPHRDGVYKEFTELKQGLNHFASLLNQPYGDERKSQHDLLWQEQQMRNKLTTVSVDPTPFEIEITNACSNSKQDIDRNSQRLDSLDKLLENRSRDQLEFTFRPLGVLPKEALGCKTLLEQAAQWAASLRAIKAELHQFSPCDDLSLEELRLSSHQAVGFVSRMPNPLPADGEALLPLLESPASAGMAQVLLDAIQSKSELEIVVARRFVSKPDPLPEVEGTQALVSALSQWRLGSIAIPHEQLEREQLRQRLKKAAKTAEGLQVLLDMSTTGLPLAGFSPSSLKALLPLVEHLSAQPDWVLSQRSQAIWHADPKQARGLLHEYTILQNLRTHLCLDQAAVQQPKEVNFDQSLEQLQLCCDRGLGAFLAQANAAQRLIEQIDEAETLFQQSSSCLTVCLPSQLLEAASLGQLLAATELLRLVLALDEDAIDLRSSSFWSIDLNAIRLALDGERDLKRREQALDQSGLMVPTGHSASELREAANLLEEKAPLQRLVNRISRTKSRAVMLAREIGAFNAQDRAEALRNVAKVVELREAFGTGWQRRMFSLELPSERLLPVVDQLQSLKRVLETSSHGPFWGSWLWETPAAKLQAALSAYEQGVERTLQALAGHGVWPASVLGHNLNSLQDSLKERRQDQCLLAEVEPVACWARAAGLGEGEAMVSWLRQVQSSTQRIEEFPQQELDTLLAGGLVVDQIDTVLSAAEHFRKLVTSSGLGAQATALMDTDQAALGQALLTLQHQLDPLVQELMAQTDLMPADANQRSLRLLAQDIQVAAKEYQTLLQQWQEAGLAPEASLADLLQLPIDLVIAHRRREEVIQALASFQQKVGQEVAGAPPEQLRQVMSWIVEVRKAGLPADVEDSCLKPGAAAFIAGRRELAINLRHALEEEATAAQRFLATAEPQPTLIGDEGTSRITDVKAQLLQEWLEAVDASHDHFPTWVKCRQVLEQLPADGTRSLAEELLASAVNGEHWSLLYRWTLVRSQLRQMGWAIPELQQLRSHEQVARRERFQSMEEELRKLDRAAVIAAIHRDPNDLPQGVNKGLKRDFTEMALIKNEIVKQKGHRPLRHLFQFSGSSLRGLKPCWMVSPGTLASLVPREGTTQFDLVIVDEASQMPPERALGLISRARQCVVVGDPKQLPPTSFFRRTDASEDDQTDDEVDNEALDEESILDLCTKAFKPVRRLKWHYRSRHGSLIAFSNKKFYNDDLTIFPSCDRDFAVHRHEVINPNYSKGVNLPEVTVVCDVVLEQLTRYPDRSLGVVAMNEAQSSEIDYELEKRAHYHDELRRRLDIKDTGEGLFVKSLEKVQGDERDTVVISTTYGPTEPGGPVGMNFGPISKEGGQRRLNVLFTRAKYAIELITSIKYEQLNIDNSYSTGTKAFRDYLKFVETKMLEWGRPSGREPDSPFEIVVAEAIQKHGYKVDCQVGVAKYFIDLAIRHPRKPETYLLGVECDGATYHSARAARDRDKYRQSVLEDKGWQIHRIWSTDWFENAEAETQKLLKVLAGLRDKQS